MSNKPYKKGYLKVSSLHKIYYEAWGNPKGTPFVFLHGGPGNGFRRGSQKHFNLKKDFVILFDQRGCKLSKPLNEFRQNTSKDLVNDISSLLDFFGIDKAVLQGRSWGSTLALLYAIQNPKRVLGLVIGGIFLGTKKELDFIFKGQIKSHFPDLWDLLISNIPKASQSDVLKFYFNKIVKSHSKDKKKWVFKWNYCMGALGLLNVDFKQLERESKQINPNCFLDLYYSVNGYFLESNYIIKNLSIIKNIPIEIEHGRYDFICLPESAYVIHKKLNKSNLRWSFASHFGSADISDKMAQGLKSIRKRLSKKSK